MTPFQKKLNKLRRDPVQFFQDIRFLRPVVSRVVPFEKKFDLVGDNWSEQAQDKQKPIAFLFNFGKKNRAVTAKLLQQYRCAFVETDHINSVKAYLDKISDKILIVWGYKEIYGLKPYVQKNDIKLTYAEDGFLRLNEPAVTPSLSLAMDDKALYFDSTKQSSLEDILNNYDFKTDKKLMRQAKSAIKKLDEHLLTKYNLDKSLTAEEAYGEKTKKRVLVIGQVETDKSILFGCDQKFTNNEMVQLAYVENPDAEIIYKPHPDVLSGRKEAISDPSKVSKFAKIVKEPMSAPEALKTIDHVYTITSLMGFEALLRGIKVTTIGAPFYSGWGLTDDRQKTPSRKRNLKVEEVFAGAYILYTKYFNPVVGEYIEVDEAIELLNFEKNYVPVAALKAIAAQDWVSKKDKEFLADLHNKELKKTDLKKIQELLANFAEKAGGSSSRANALMVLFELQKRLHLWQDALLTLASAAKFHSLEELKDQVAILKKELKPEKLGVVGKALANSTVNSIKVFEGLADYFIELEDCENADFLLQKAYAIRPSDKKLNLKYASNLVELEKFKNAVEIYESLFAANPKDFDVLCDYADCLIAEGRYEQAYEKLSLAKKRTKGNVFLSLKMGGLAQRMGNEKLAREYYLECIKLNDLNFADDQKYLKKEKRHVERALSKRKTSDFAASEISRIAKYALILLQNDEFAEAREVLEGMKNDKTSANLEFVNIYVECLIKHQEFDEAEAAIFGAMEQRVEKAKERDLTTADVKYISSCLGIFSNLDIHIAAFGRKLDNPQRLVALAEFLTKEFKNKKPDVDLQRFSYLMFLVTEALTSFRLYNEMLSVADEFFAKKKDDIKYLIMMGNILTKCRKRPSLDCIKRQKKGFEAYECALKAVAKGLKKTPNDLKLLEQSYQANLGLKNYDAAAEALRKLLDINERVLAKSPNSTNALVDESRFLLEYALLPENTNNQMLRQRLHSQLEKLEKCYNRSSKHRTLLRTMGEIARRLGLKEQAMGYFAVYDKLTNDIGIINQTSNVLMVSDEYELSNQYGKWATQLHKEMSRKSLSVGKYLERIHYYNLHANNKYFLIQTAEIMKKVPQPQNPKGLVFVPAFRCLNTIAMIVPVLLKLRQEGYATVHLSEGVLPFQPTGIEAIDKYHGLFRTSCINLQGEVLGEEYLRLNWKVDWENEIVEESGINYYHTFYERLMVHFRRHSIKMDDPDVAYRFYHALRETDRQIFVARQIHQEIAKDMGLPVRFISGNAHLGAYAACKKYCEIEGVKDNVHFITVNTGYQNYYNNIGNKLSCTVGMIDATANPKLRMPFLSARESFEAWMNQGNTAADHKEEIDKWLNTNRVQSDGMNGKSKEIYDKINAAKKAGKKIICFYGKIPFDLAVPFDGGPAHKDMKDWINHSVEVAKKTDDIFIIKPHPHELRTEIARDATEFLKDLVEVEMPDNVIYMDHGWFNNSDLVPLLDVGVLWNGTSSLELGAQGIPVIMAAHFGKYDYPVDLYYPKDRKDYEKLLLNPEKLKISKKVSEECALLLKYMSTDEITIPYNYVKRPATNDPIGSNLWYMDEIDDFLKNGDKYIDLLANRVLEYINGGVNSADKKKAKIIDINKAKKNGKDNASGSKEGKRKNV